MKTFFSDFQTLLPPSRLVFFNEAFGNNEGVEAVKDFDESIASIALDNMREVINDAELNAAANQISDELESVIATDSDALALAEAKTAVEASTRTTLNGVEFAVNVVGTETKMENGVTVTYTNKIYTADNGLSFKVNIAEKITETPPTKFESESPFVLDQTDLTQDAFVSATKEGFGNYLEALRKRFAGPLTAEQKEFIKQNPFQVNVSSSPEYGDRTSYAKAAEYNLALASRRAETIMNTVGMADEQYKDYIQISIPEDGMNFPADIRSQLDDAQNLAQKDEIYREYLAGESDENLSKLRLTDSSFSLPGEQKTEKTVQTEVLSPAKKHPSVSLFENAAALIIDETGSMKEEIRKLGPGVINNPNRNILKNKKATRSGAEMEQHLFTIEDVVSKLPKIKEGEVNNQVVVYTDEPDTSIPDREKYVRRMERVLRKADRKGYEVTFVISNPSDRSQEKVLTVTPGNADKFIPTRGNFSDKISADKAWFKNIPGESRLSVSGQIEQQAQAAENFAALAQKKEMEMTT